jgi:4-amino-4-deoxy-L-arabinose transferase-like glycosyltransferase
MGVGRHVAVSKGVEVLRAHPLRAWIALFMLLGLAARIVYVVSTWHFTPWLDNYGYVQRGLYLWENQGRLLPVVMSWHHRRVVLPDAYWPPGYPAFLAVLIAVHQLLHVIGLIGALPQAGVPKPIHGSGVLALYQYLRVLSSALGTVTVPLTAWITLRLAGRRAALVAAFLMALYPPLIYVGASLYSESLFVPLMLAAIACVIAFTRGGRWWWLLLAGVTMGLVALVHSDGAVLIVPLLLGAWLGCGRPRRRRRALWAPALLAVAAGLTIMPWTIRNEVDFHSFIPLSTSFSMTLAGTYNPKAATDQTRPGLWILPSQAFPKLSRRFGLPGTQQDRQFEKAAVKYLKRNPGYVWTVWRWNTLRLFELTGPVGPDGSEFSAPFEGIPSSLTWVGDIALWLLGLFAIAACFTRTLRRSRHMWVWLVPVLNYLVTVFITVETPRFRSGIDPFIVILAAVAIASAWERFKPARRDSRASATTTSTAAVEPALRT